MVAYGKRGRIAFNCFLIAIRKGDNNYARINQHILCFSCFCDESAFMKVLMCICLNPESSEAVVMVYEAKFDMGMKNGKLRYYFFTRY